MLAKLTALARLLLALALACSVGGAVCPGDPVLPRPTGPLAPRGQPMLSEGGFAARAGEPSFLSLRADFAAAKAGGKHKGLAVVFGQRGSGYASIDTDVLALRSSNDDVRENFMVVQLDVGAHTITAFDGTLLSEPASAERWGVIFAPTVAFFRDETGLEGTWAGALEAIALRPLSFADTFCDLFVWVRLKLYARDRSLRRFHIAGSAERQALKATPYHTSRTN